MEEPSPDARPVQKLEPAPKDGRPSPQRTPIDIETLFTDEEILDLIRQSFPDDETLTTSGVDFEADSGTEVGSSGELPGATIDARPGVVGRPGFQSSVTQRGATPGSGAITGRKEPIFGGDPGQQQDVWNVRSLRLRKALGL